jgi:hypothetical protein
MPEDGAILYAPAQAEIRLTAPGLLLQWLI